MTAGAGTVSCIRYQPPPSPSPLLALPLSLSLLQLFDGADNLRALKYATLVSNLSAQRNKPTSPKARGVTGGGLAAPSAIKTLPARGKCARRFLGNNLAWTSRSALSRVQLVAAVACNKLWPGSGITHDAQSPRELSSS